MTENKTSKITFDSALKAHGSLGPDLLESTYEEFLFSEWNKTGLKIEKQQPLPLAYESVKLDMLINFNVTLIKNGIRRIVNKL